MSIGLVTAALVTVLSCSGGTDPVPGGVGGPGDAGSGAAVPASPGTGPRSPSHPGGRTEVAADVVAAVSGRVAGSRVGLTVYDRATARTVAEHDPGGRYFTASVIKLAIATRVLRTAGWRPPPPGPERERLVRMLAASDDPVASELWARYGGPAVVHRTVAEAGLRATTPPAEPAEWELTVTTPRDLRILYTYVTDGIPDPAADLVLGALSGARTTAADGLDQSFGIRSALPDTETAVKQGWMRVDGELVLHTTGLVGADHRYVVVLLSRHPAGTDLTTAATALTEGVATLAPALTGIRPPPGSAGNDCPPGTRAEGPC